MSDKYNYYKKYQDARYNLARKDMYRQLYFQIADSRFTYNERGMLALMVKPPYEPDDTDTPYEIITHLKEGNLLVMGTSESVTDELLAYLKSCHDSDKTYVVNKRLASLRERVLKLEAILDQVKEHAT